MTKVVNDFIEYFKSLPEAEKFKLGRTFNEQTGGKLSQYNNPVAVMVGMIQVEDEGVVKLLGVRRGINPHIGGIAFPGGFQEHMEEATTTVTREVFEETGLNTNPEDYEVCGNPVMSPTNNMLIFFKNKHIYPKSILKELKLSSEVLEFVLIDEKTQLCFPLHDEKAKSFFGEKANKMKKLKF